MPPFRSSARSHPAPRSSSSKPDLSVILSHSEESRFPPSRSFISFRMIRHTVNYGQGSFFSFPSARRVLPQRLVISDVLKTGSEYLVGEKNATRLAKLSGQRSPGVA